MSWKEKIKTSFEKNSDLLFKALQPGEEATLNLSAEDSDFVRFNKGKVRQTTSVEQAQVKLVLQANSRINKISFPITGDLQEDRKRFLLYLGKCRNEMAQLPENPYPIRLAETGRSESDAKANTPTAAFIIDKVAQDAAHDDFVGYMSSGPLMEAMANSRGTYHWYSSDSYFVDYSLYDGKNAVTHSVAGSNWNEMAWKNSLQDARSFLNQMKKPRREIPRGDYRVYLAPATLTELLPMIAWGGFSQSAFRQGSCGLKRLYENAASFSSLLTMGENFELGFSSRMNEIGEISPVRLPLIEKGKGVNLLTSPKSAAEYKVPSNAANEQEFFRSLEVQPGTLKREDILKTLDTGLYISNLHYVNWSDREAARLTGMTRFACFWVEKGEIQSPIKDLRFDVSLYDIWGPGLVNLTDFQESFVSKSTYMQRTFGGMKVPGMLIQDFKFTL